MSFSRSLIRMFNRTGPRIKSCGTPLITAFQVEYDHKLLCSECDHPDGFLPIKLSTQLDQNPMHTRWNMCGFIHINKIQNNDTMYMCIYIFH